MSSIDLEYEMLLITLGLYNNAVIPRNVVQSFVCTLIKFTSNTFSHYILQQVKNTCKCSQETLDALVKIFADTANIFNKFDTEYKRIELYKDKKLLVEPLTVELKKFGKVSELQHCPLRWTLKTFLEIPGVYETMIKYMDELKYDDKIVSNVIQAGYWKQFSLKIGTRIVIPLFFSHDDFEAGDALGSHAGQNCLGDVFVTLPCFPSHIASKLENIFLADLFYAKDRKEFGNEAIFSELIAELNFLQREGLVIQLDKEEIRVHFQPCLEIGDNKSLNEDQGYQDTYIHGRPCRMCRADMTQIRHMVKEVEALMRTMENYQEDLKSKCPAETGLLEECVFNKLDDYNNLDNGGMDLMHDVFEGGGSALFLNVLNDLINKQQRFNFQFLVDRIEWFNKNTLDISNKIPVLKKRHLTGKQKLKMSAAEMMNFIRFFGILVGNKIDRYVENETWTLFINFRKIVDILLSPRIVEGHIMRLTCLIPDFLSLYIKLYDELFFKLHNLIHVIRMLRRFGPLIYYWAMRMESKHRDLKIVATTTNNTVNLLKTIAMRNQLKLAYTKLVGSMNLEDVEVHCYREIDLREKLEHFRDLQSETKVFSTTNLKFRGIEYHINTLLVIEMGDDDLLNFGLIKDIYIVKNDVFLLVQPHNVLYFDDHVYAYNVVAREAFVLKNVKDLPDIHTCVLVQDDNVLYAVPKYVL